MQVRVIEDAGVEETLDELERLHDVRTDVEARMFVLAAHFADLHPSEALPVSRRVLAGMERSVRVGGDGTPRISEFACSELGCRLQMSPGSARRYVADALDVRHRLPLIWGPGHRPAGADRERPAGRLGDPAPDPRGRRDGGQGDGA